MSAAVTPYNTRLKQVLKQEIEADISLNQTFGAWVSIKAFGADPLASATANATAFAAADADGRGIYVPLGSKSWDTTTIPNGRYFGEGVISVNGELFYLASTPQRLNAPMTTPGVRRQNFANGQGAGLSWGPNAQANVANGPLSQRLNVSGIRNVTDGWATLENAVAPEYNALTGDSAGRYTTYMTRCAGHGANVFKWGGCSNPVATGHDFYLADWTQRAEREAAWPTEGADGGWRAIVGPVTGPVPAQYLPTTNEDFEGHVASGRDTMIHALKGRGDVVLGEHAHEGFATSNILAIGQQANEFGVINTFGIYHGALAGRKKFTGEGDIIIGHYAAPNLTHGININIEGYNACYNLTGESTLRADVEARVHNITARGTSVLYGLLQGYRLDFTGCRGGFNLTIAQDTVGTGYSTYEGVTSVYKGAAHGVRAGIGNANGLTNTYNYGALSGGLTLSNTGKLGNAMTDANVSGRVFSGRNALTSPSSQNVTMTTNVLWLDYRARTGPTAAFTDTTPTAAQIVASIPGCEIGSGKIVRTHNKTAYAMTIAPGGGVTMDGLGLSGANLSIPAGYMRALLIRVTNVTAGSEAVTVIGLEASNQ